MIALAIKEQAHVGCEERTFASAAASALYDAITHSAGTDSLDQLARAIWRGFGEGAINDDDAAALQSLIDRRRPLAVGRRGAGSRALGKIVSRFTPRRRRRLTNEQRQAARERRRTLGSSADAPANIRCQYTEGERAVLFVIVGEVKHHGLCDLPIGKIASLAGVCRTTVQTTLHEARRLGHMKITERPRYGRESLTNVVHIVSAEWLVWLKRGPSEHRPGGTGSKNFLRNDNNSLNPTKSIYFKNRSGEKERRRRAGPPPDMRGRRA